MFKSGYTNRQVCTILNVTPSTLDEAGLPAARHPVPSYTKVIGAKMRKSVGVNANLEISQRMYGSWQGVTALDLRKNGSPLLKAMTAAAGMEGKPATEKDRTTSGESTNSPGEISRNVKPNRNQLAASVFQGHGPVSTGEDDIISLYGKNRKNGAMKKSVYVPESGDYSFDEITKHTANAMEAIDYQAKRMSLTKAIEFIGLRLPLPIRCALVKRLYLQGRKIPESLEYCLG